MHTWHFSKHLDSSTVTGTSTRCVIKAIVRCDGYINSGYTGMMGSREWGVGSRGMWNY